MTCPILVRVKSFCPQTRGCGEQQGPGLGQGAQEGEGGLAGGAGWHLRGDILHGGQCSSSASVAELPEERREQEERCGGE